MSPAEDADQPQGDAGSSGPSYGPSGGPPPYSPYGPYVPSPAYGPPRHPDALTALVLGAASLVVFPPLGPFAWHIGAKAGREMATAPGRWSGDDLAKTGMVLGIVGSALCLLFVLFFVLFFAIGFGVLGMTFGVVAVSTT